MAGVGDWIQCHDGKSGWYDAKIVGEDGKGDDRKVKVHYHGWSRSMDEWINVVSSRIKEEEEALPAALMTKHVQSVVHLRARHT